jgi:hypothetical protein
MTTQLIRMQAREIAGIFYEQHQRTLRFRRQWPVQDDYVNSQWPHFVAVGKAALVQLMLAQDTPQHQKDAIEEELIADGLRSANDPRARDVLQASLAPREREDIKHADATPLIGVAD